MHGPFPNLIITQPRASHCINDSTPASLSDSQHPARGEMASDPLTVRARRRARPLPRFDGCFLSGLKVPRSSTVSVLVCYLLRFRGFSSASKTTSCRPSFGSGPGTNWSGLDIATAMGLDFGWPQGPGLAGTSEEAIGAYPCNSTHSGFLDMRRISPRQA